MLRDPVCGKRVNRHRAQAAVEYERITYYLCCPLCQKEFERAPDKYAHPEWGERSKRDRKRKGGRRSGGRATKVQTTREGRQ